MKPKLEPVVVTWVDSVSHEDGWEGEEDVKPAKIEHCVSYGIISRQTEKALVVSPHLGLTDKGWDQASGSMTIPMCQVVSIRRLNLGRWILEDIDS